MCSGIYAYWDNVNGYYAYVGKDSYIDLNKRHKAHLSPSLYDKQAFNSVLQNNPNRYEYRVIMKGNYDDLQLNKMEKLCIKCFKTFKKDYPERSVFNFTKGGDGASGYEHQEESKKKISKSMSGESHWNYGGKPSEETRRKMSESHKGLQAGENNPNWKDSPRIVKCGVNAGKQNYGIVYDGKKIKQSFDRKNLESFLKEYYNEIISSGEIKEKTQYKIVKCGFLDNGKQRYGIYSSGKILKKSIYIKKLKEWFKNNYPNEVLQIGVDL